jgi:hypothetical protein
MSFLLDSCMHGGTRLSHVTVLKMEYLLNTEYPFSSRLSSKFIREKSIKKLQILSRSALYIDCGLVGCTADIQLC